MNVIVVGLGCFGFNWLETILLSHENIRITGLVDKNQESLHRAKGLFSSDRTVFYTDFQECLSSVDSDFTLNVTPPNAHKEITLAALEHGIPVLCEKPITENYKDADEILKKSISFKIPVMIAENYRFTSIMRAAKKLIHSGEIGKLNSVHIDFQRKHRIENYHKNLKHPLLLDVAIHHIDLIRYLTGVEAESIFAESWTPAWSWYRGNSNLNFLLNMQEQIKVCYRGSLSDFKNETDWPADWRFEGEKGIIGISGQKITIEKADETSVVEISETMDSRRMVLDEFMSSLKEKRAGETDITDNIRTFQIVHAAMESVERREIVQINHCQNLRDGQKYQYPIYRYPVNRHGKLRLPNVARRRLLGE